MNRKLVALTGVSWGSDGLVQPAYNPRNDSQGCLRQCSGMTDEEDWLV